LEDHLPININPFNFIQMKFLKYSIAAIVILSLMVIGFSYATKSKKTITTVTYYFDCSVGLTRGGITPGTQVLIQSEVTSTANWVTTAQSCSSGAFLCSITFDQEPGDVSDGISDGQYSLQEAINAVWAEYIRNNQFDLPTHGNCFTPSVTGASAICIRRAASNSCFMNHTDCNLA
jgi:hypothetical protein